MGRRDCFLELSFLSACKVDFLTRALRWSLASLFCSWRKDFTVRSSELSRADFSMIESNTWKLSSPGSFAYCSSMMFSWKKLLHSAYDSWLKAWFFKSWISMSHMFLIWKKMGSTSGRSFLISFKMMSTCSNGDWNLIAPSIFFISSCEIFC